jgi:methylglutaconyl-CoA hydratase
MAQAYRMGLIHEIAPAEAFDGKANAIVDALAMSERNAIGECKKLIDDMAGREIDEALIAKTADRIARVRASDEAKKGLQNFLHRKRLR